MRNAQRSSERGQVLVLFVVLFSALLVLAAFSIDQGLWLNHRRIAQKDADAAARAGAAQYIKDIEDAASLYGDASAAALGIAAANGAGTDVGTAPDFSPDCDAGDATGTTCARASCPLEGGDIIDGAPSIEIAVPRPAPGLFIRALGGDDAEDIGAKSTACVGSATTVSLDTQFGIPVEIFDTETMSSNPNNCFYNSSLARVGMQCVIKYAAQNQDNGNRGYFRGTEENECDGGGGAPPVSDGIENGLNFTCSINTGGPCVTTTPFQDCVDPKPGTVTSTLDSWNARLEGNGDIPLTCSSDGFRDTFDYGGGRPGPVLGPPGLASTNINEWNPPTAGRDAPGTVYQQKNCQNPRVALIVISDDTEERVKGFAAIFITGCFDEDDPELTNQLNVCGPADQYGGHTEVRAVLLRIFLTQGTAGDIGPPDPTSPLAIQTTR